MVKPQLYVFAEPNGAEYTVCTSWQARIPHTKLAPAWGAGKRLIVSTRTSVENYFGHSGTLPTPEFFNVRFKPVN